MDTRRLKIAFLLCLAGICTAWIISFAYVLHLQLPCGGSTGCTTVAMSPAARLAGVPVPVFGLVYFVILALLMVRSLLSQSKTTVSIPYLVAIAGAAVSTGLTVYGVVVLHAECIWCIASNIIACLVAGLLALGQSEVSTERKSQGKFLLIASILGTLVIAASPKLILANAKKFPWNPEALAKASLADMAPEDSVLLNGSEKGPTIVMFVDLECPACDGAFQTVYGIALKDKVRLAIRHRPHRKIHPDSYALAIQAEEATQQEQGLNYLIRVFKQSIDSQRKGWILLRSLNARESPQLVQVAKDRIARDKAFAKRLGLIETPSVFLVMPGQPPKAVVVESLEDLLRPR